VVDVEVRREIREGLQVVVSWNFANEGLFYGEGDLAGVGKGSREVGMLSLCLFQSVLVQVDMLLIREVLAVPKWVDRLIGAERRRCRRCCGPT
jgi:TnpA family transposase